MTCTQEQTQAQRNIELVRRYQAGDCDALAELTAENDGLVIDYVNQIASRLNLLPRDPHLHDFRQEGRIALIDAARQFDLNRGFEFSTYARRVIVSRVNRWASRHMGCVVVPQEAHRNKSMSEHVKRAHFCRGGMNEDFWAWQQGAIGTSPIDMLEQREEHEHRLKLLDCAIQRLPKVRRMAILEKLEREMIDHGKTAKNIGVSYLDAIKQLRSIIRREQTYGRSCAMES